MEQYIPHYILDSGTYEILIPNMASVAETDLDTLDYKENWNEVYADGEVNGSSSPFTFSA